MGSSASSTGSVLMGAEVRATSAASRAARSAASGVNSDVAAKPQVPSSSTRTDKPARLIFGRASSRWWSRTRAVAPSVRSEAELSVAGSVTRGSAERRAALRVLSGSSANSGSIWWLAIRRSYPLPGPVAIRPDPGPAPWRHRPGPARRRCPAGCRAARRKPVGGLRQQTDGAGQRHHCLHPFVGLVPAAEAGQRLDG